MVIQKVAFNAVTDVVFDDGTVTEPVTKAQVKSFCKLNTGTTEDALLDIFITAARIQCEQYCNIGFIPREVTAIINNSCGNVYLPFGPVTLPVTSIKDSDGVDISDYEIQGTKWARLVKPTLENITIVYNAGYEDLPGELKLAVLQQVFYLYENRGESNEISRSGVVEIHLSAEAKATLNRLRRNL
jgi:uncharacterized phiE125 gp8 family phage protein